MKTRLLKILITIVAMSVGYGCANNKNSHEQVIVQEAPEHVLSQDENQSHDYGIAPSLLSDIEQAMKDLEEMEQEEKNNRATAI